MATIAEKMAVSLEELRKLQEQHPCVVLQGTKEIGRTHLTRLLDNGWLQEVMKGWYIAARPGAEGDTTVWYTAFWHFIAGGVVIGAARRRQIRIIFAKPGRKAGFWFTFRAGIAILASVDKERESRNDHL